MQSFQHIWDVGGIPSVFKDAGTGEDKRQDLQCLNTSLRPGDHCKMCYNTPVLYMAHKPHALSELYLVSYVQTTPYEWMDLHLII